MNVRLLFFASLREAIGKSEQSLVIPDGLSAGELSAHLVEQLGLGEAADRSLNQARVAVNEELVPAAHIICDGDTVALLPPVTGG